MQIAELRIQPLTDQLLAINKLFTLFVEYTLIDSIVTVSKSFANREREITSIALDQRGAISEPVNDGIHSEDCRIDHRR